MALVHSNVCDPFDRISQREVLARILAEDSQHEDSYLSTSDSEQENDEQGKKVHSKKL